MNWQHESISIKNVSYSISYMYFKFVITMLIRMVSSHFLQQVVAMYAFDKN